MLVQFRTTTIQTLSKYSEHDAGYERNIKEIFGRFLDSIPHNSRMEQYGEKLQWSAA